MRQLYTLLKKEVMSFFFSYTAYFVMAVYVLLSMMSTFYLGGYFGSYNSDLYSFFYFQPQILMLIVPAITMRAWSDEKKTGTMEVILSYPVSYGALVFAKFWACFKVAALMILLTVPLWVYSVYNLNIDNGAVLWGYIGCLFAAAMFCAVGCWISAMTSSPVVAYLVSVLILWLWGSVSFDFVLSPIAYLSGSIFVMAQGAFSFVSHYNSFISAQVGFDGVTYFLSIIFVVLLFNRVIIENRKVRSLGRIAVIGMLFFVVVLLVNVLSAVLFSTSKADFTSDKRYSLSEASRDIIELLPGQVDVKVYVSKNMRNVNPSLADYSQFVVSYLEKYRKYSKGEISVDLRTVEPYGVLEKEAKEAGVASFVAGNDELIYFGAVISDSFGRSHTINSFIPERRQYLERDISRALYKLVQEKPKTIGWVNTLGFSFSDEIITKVLKEDYNIEQINQQEIVIPAKVDALVVVNMQHMSRFLAYGVDQFLMIGSGVLGFVDNINSQQQNKDYSIYTPKLLESWGLKYYNDFVVTENLLVDKKVVVDKDNKFVVSDIMSVNLDRKYMDQASPLVRNLASLQFISPALVLVEDKDDVEVKTLAMTSNKSGVVSTDIAKLTDDRYIAESQIVTSDRHGLIMKARGLAKSMFVENILAETKYEDVMPPYLPATIEETDFVVVADADFLKEDAWNYFGDKLNAYSLILPNNNLDFVIRAVDYLSGNEILLGLDGKRFIQNSQSIIDEMRLEVRDGYMGALREIDAQMYEKEEEAKRLLGGLKGDFSMGVMKDVERLTREIGELKEKSKYVNQLMESRVNERLYSVVIMLAVVIPIVMILMIWGCVGICRRWRKKMVLEMLK